MKKKTNTLIEIVTPEHPFPVRKIKEFNVDLTKLHKLTDEYSVLKIDGVKDHAGLKKVNVARKELKGYRVNVDKRRKELNGDMLLKMRFNNAAAKFIIKELLPTELYLRAQEKEIKNQKETIRLEKKRAKMEKLQGRINALNAFEMPFEITSIEFLTDRQFTKLLAQAEILFNEKKVVKEQNAKKMAEETSRVINENLDLKAKIENVDLDELTESNATVNLPVENIPNNIPADETSLEEKIVKVKNDISEYAISLKLISPPLFIWIPPSFREKYLYGIKKIEEGINILLDAIK